MLYGFRNKEGAAAVAVAAQVASWTSLVEKKAHCLKTEIRRLVSSLERKKSPIHEHTGRQNNYIWGTYCSYFCSLRSSTDYSVSKVNTLSKQVFMISARTPSLPFAPMNSFKRNLQSSLLALLTNYLTCKNYYINVLGKSNAVNFFFSLLSFTLQAVPDGPLELYNPSHDVFYLLKHSRSPDFEALKLWKGRSGTCYAFWPQKYERQQQLGKQRGEEILF